MPRAIVISHSFLERDPRVSRAVEALVDEGWNVDGLFLDPPRRDRLLRTWQVPIGRRRGSPLRYVLEYGAFFLWSLLWIGHRSFWHKPDIIYINSPPDFLAFAGALGKLRRIPVILDVHDPMPELFVAKGNRTGLVVKALDAQERWSAKFADRVITVHEPLRDLLQQRSPQIDMDIVMNVPDTTGWPETTPDPASRLIVYTGSIAIRYGLEELMRALAQVRSEIPGIALRLTGEGEDTEKLRDLAVELGIDDIVEFAGRVPWEEIIASQSDAWVGVNVPRPDDLGHLSFSNKVVEWVAMGLPVIAARTPTMERYFPDGTHWYVEPGSADAIAEALLTLHTADAETLANRKVASQAALEAIAWPVQRRRLMEVVEATRRR